MVVCKKIYLAQNLTEFKAVNTLNDSLARKLKIIKNLSNNIT